jgi:hypothetical protein
MRVERRQCWVRLSWGFVDHGRSWEGLVNRDAFERELTDVLRESLVLAILRSGLESGDSGFGMSIWGGDETSGVRSWLGSE